MLKPSDFMQVADPIKVTEKKKSSLGCSTGQRGMANRITDDTHLRAGSVGDTESAFGFFFETRSGTTARLTFVLYDVLG